MSMKMHVLSGGWLRMRKSVYLPDAAREETLDLPVSCFLLRHPQGNVLFDTGCHPSVLEDAPSRWGSMARVMQPMGKPEENLMFELNGLGVRPTDIDVVVCSHLHSDHCGCNEFFRSATMICHSAELRNAKAAGAAAQGFLAVDWDHGLETQCIDREHDLFGDSRITLMPLPGHTEGMIGALVSLERDGDFLLASDSVPLMRNLDENLIPKNTWDPVKAQATYKEIRHLARTGATVMCGHDAEQWQMLRKGGEIYQ